jgi:hypothetical protein
MMKDENRQRIYEILKKEYGTFFDQNDMSEAISISNEDLIDLWMDKEALEGENATLKQALKGANQEIADLIEERWTLLNTSATRLQNCRR